MENNHNEEAERADRDSTTDDRLPPPAQAPPQQEESSADPPWPPARRRMSPPRQQAALRRIAHMRQTSSNPQQQQQQSAVFRNPHEAMLRRPRLAVPVAAAAAAASAAASFHNNHNHQNATANDDNTFLLYHPPPRGPEFATTQQPRVAAAGDEPEDSRLPQDDAEAEELLFWDQDDDTTDDPKQAHPTSGWSTVQVSNEPGAGVPPSARSLHAAALLNGTMYIFGGFDGQTRVNSFFAFCFAERRWSPVLPAAHSGPPPSPRDRHVAVAFANSIYVHGGFDGTSRVADFWAFDFSTMTWRQVVALQGTPPSARHSHCAAVMNHSLYLCCGYDGSYKNDIYQFDFTLSRWTTLRVSGRRPRARYRATLNAMHRPTPCLILHGGHDGTRHLSDTHVFDVATHEWSSLAIDGVPPIPRDSHVAVPHGNSLYVFGGSSGAALNDLHELQLPSVKDQPARWRPVAMGSNPPQPRFCHAAVVYQDTLYCFGGYSGSERINEFLRFDFALYDLTFDVPAATIQTDLRAMVNNPTLSDVTFVVEGRELYAHKFMLVRCEYFQSLFLGSMREASLERIPIAQVRYPIFLSLLEYLYTDHVRIPLNCAMELFEAADLFMIPRLKTICEKRMLQSISVSNAASIFYAADMHSATALRQKAKNYILSHFEEISKTRSFEEMGRGNIDLVFELLKSR